MGRALRRTWSAAVLLLAALPWMRDDLSSDPGAVYAPGSGSDECAQTAYAVHDARLEHPYIWVLDESSVPDYLDAAGAVRAVREATDTVALARSRCAGVTATPPVIPPVIYTGTTERSANVTGAATCFPEGNTDGVNVVSFGPLPDDVVAVTCTYTEGGEIWQSDVMLNDAPGVFTLDPADGCEQRYDLQAVMTHERGHSFGLAHVPERPGSDALTMSSAMGRCDTSARTLAAGDVLGLARLY